MDPNSDSKTDFNIEPRLNHPGKPEYKLNQHYVQHHYTKTKNNPKNEQIALFKAAERRLTPNIVSDDATLQSQCFQVDKLNVLNDYPAGNA